MSSPFRPSRAARLCLIASLLWAPRGPFAARPAHGQETDLGVTLRGRVEAIRSGESSAGERRILARGALPLFYEGRGFVPAWVGEGTPPRRLDALERAIRRAAAHGLDPEDYHRVAIAELRDRIRSGGGDETDLADLELLASDAFLVLGSHLLNGRVNPETIEPEWLANRRSARMDEVLESAIESGSIEGTLYALAPAEPRYGALLASLERLRTVVRDGGWPEIPAGPALELGGDDARVPVLRARLMASGDLLGRGSAGTAFDETLEQAVRTFQARHGLEPDGVVGSATLAALNVSADQRVRQIETNLERWRWLPADLGVRHIEVNIAGFDVKVVEQGRTVRRYRAVVGRQYRQTPMFSGSMTYLVLSPYWHVPPNIAAADKLPAIKADPTYLASQNISLLDRTTNERVDPSTVDWDAMTGAELNQRFRLRQDPGPMNALGRVKFMFPNRHNVYLHDTPSRELFARSSRTFSSGCIRIEDPLDLAEYLLADQPGWTRERIDRTVAEGVERTVPLVSPVPVHLLYWTAWADSDGTIQFRDDIYGRDRTVDHALHASPPGA